jgi:hypothetical protein
MNAPLTHPAPLPIPETPFVNEMRLSARQWLVVIGLVVVAVILAPPLWGRIERFDSGPDYRIPYALSKDYWLYARRLKEVSRPEQVVVLGDSVVWGEYVRPDGTLSHFLNREAGELDRFVNGGVNGLFPLALEGLVRYYGSALRHHRVLLHCNVLWMSSPKADLQVTKEERFNHSRLVPQFRPRIPCYRADANERLSAVVEREVPFLAWVDHLQNAYFDQKSILQWTLADDGNDPPRYPNCYRDPLSQITLSVPSAPRDDPQRGPGSPRHKPWTAAGSGPVRFEWVTLDSSLQWAAFRRLIEVLQSRGNDVVVVLGPFNEHIIAEEDRPALRRVTDGIRVWLTERQIQFVVPALLPSERYADASHPLTDGYALLARQLSVDPVLHKWVGQEAAARPAAR